MSIYKVITIVLEFFSNRNCFQIINLFLVVFKILPNYNALIRNYFDIKLSKNNKQ